MLNVCTPHTVPHCAHPGNRRNCGRTVTSTPASARSTSSSVRHSTRPEPRSRRAVLTRGAGSGITVREGAAKGDHGARAYTPTDPAEYPNNLRLADLAYFVAAPTLCYETRFPRTERIRWGFLIKRTVELVIIMFFEYFIAVQYMLPLLQNTLAPFSRMEVLFLSEVR